ncbi:MAG TPA: pirin family protein [Polyangiaceae bacterium]|nr:pirin family protein [Polyangiaceae bacterium]
MSVESAEEPLCFEPGGSIELVVTARPRDLGGFSVGRVLPAMQRRLVGPFIFFDHMTRHELAPGHGMDVRPHPHIGLATVTYLFDGEIIHRDSLGSRQAIVAGDVNWMSAGRGIVHSERTGDERRRTGGVVHGIQSWVALPAADEEMAPSFEHHPRETLPLVERPGARLRILAGHAYGARSPVGVRSPTLYAHAELDDGAHLPLTDEHDERAAYVVEGEIGCEGPSYGPGSMLIFRKGAGVGLHARGATRVMLLGGAALEGPRHIFWNFVATSKDRIERAKQEWKEGAFPRVPGDDVEFIPLPE